jgi:threonine aldolase
VARVLNAVDGIECPPEEVETNIVMARITRQDLDAPTLSSRLREQGVLALPQNARCLRVVTHMDVGAADVERLERALAAVVEH